MFWKLYDLAWWLAKPSINPERFSTDYPRRSVWIHAASVGELQVAIPLMTKISEPLFTVTSKNGLAALAKRDIKGYLLPADTTECVKKALEQIDPKFILFVESEFWPNLARQIIQNGYPYGILNLKISNSFLNSPLYFFKKGFWEHARFIFVQNQKTADILTKFGVRNCEITGNLKLALAPKIEHHFVDQLKQLKTRFPRLISVASLRKGEEAVLGPVIKRLADEIPDVCFLIFPRYLEHVTYFTNQFAAFGCRPSVYPQISRFTIINQFGLVSSGVSESVFYTVGGTFIKGIGGHNPVEGARFGVVGISGPYDYKIRDQMDLYIRTEHINLTYQTLRSLLLNPKQLTEYKTVLESAVRKAETYIDRCCEIVKCICGEN